MEKINKINKNDEFIDKSKKTHGEKYDYSLVNYVNSKKKVKIICSIHGVFEQSPVHHYLRKHGCPKCSINKKLNTSEYINKAIKIHGNKYDYSLVNYVNAKTKIKIICPAHGIFEQEAGSHTDQKTGCPMCSKKYNYSTKEFIEMSINLHGDKYDYSLVNYKNNYSKIIILCKTHGEFNQIPSNHLSGKGCDLCNSSKNENLIALFLTKKNIDFIPQYKFNDCKNIKKLPFDFYLPSYNTCIEFQGRQHYEPIAFFGGDIGFLKQQKRDEIKEIFCQKNNIKLIKIKYNDNIFNILSTQLKLN